LSTKITQALNCSGASSDIQVGVIGLIIELTLQERGSILDVSSATTKQIVFKKPDNSKVTVDAVFTTDGKDGKIQYTTGSITIIDHAGTWQTQGYISVAGFTGYSTVSEFLVNDNL